MITDIATNPDGRKILGVSLSFGGLNANFLNIGACLQELRLDGWAHGLVLGHPDPAFYLDNLDYLGTIVGPVANRIAYGRADIDGAQHRFDQNTAAGHTLHGGAQGSARRVWRLGDHGDNFVEFHDDLPDGLMGFPGNRRVTVRYSLLENATLDLQIFATTDAPTLCALAQHSYFTLTNAGQLGDHDLMVAAQSYLPVDETLIPTGDVRPVADSRFDFRAPRPLAAEDIDHNFCLSNQQMPLRDVAELHGIQTGLSMHLATTEAGLQVYTGRGLDQTRTLGHHSQPYRAGSGIALEAQNWPDAANHASFPSPLLLPGERYFQHTQFRFLCT